MALRDYQQRAIDQIREHFSVGRRRVLLHMATGAGKTVCFSHMLNEASIRGRNSIMVVRGKQLVEQASQRLFREGIRHGVIQANHWNRDRGAKVQICSIDTLTRRELRPPADLIVVDEAHLATTGKYREFIESYSGAFVVAVTATPYCKESLRHLAEEVVHPVTVQELIDLGFLVRPRYFSPSAPDLKGVRMMAGDYEPLELENRMNKLTGDLVGHWRKFSKERPTLCFAVSIQHSQSIVDQFNSAGIPAEHIEADHSFAEREAAIERLRTGVTKLISNVGIFCTGVDIPFLSCILMARPTKSYNLFIQQAGRGTRPFPNKSDFILLDHAANVTRHGFITDEPEVHLDGIPRTKRSPIVTMCKECYAMYEGSACPECGYTHVTAQDRKGPEEVSGVLKEITSLSVDDEINLFIVRMKEIAKRKGYKQGWAYYKTKDMYGEEVANAKFKKRHVPHWVVRKSRPSNF